MNFVTGLKHSQSMRFFDVILPSIHFQAGGHHHRGQSYTLTQISDSNQPVKHGLREETIVQRGNHRRMQRTRTLHTQGNDQPHGHCALFLLNVILMFTFPVYDRSEYTTVHHYLNVRMIAQKYLFLVENSAILFSTKNKYFWKDYIENSGPKVETQCNKTE